MVMLKKYQYIEPFFLNASLIEEKFLLQHLKGLKFLQLFFIYINQTCLEKSHFIGIKGTLVSYNRCGFSVKNIKLLLLLKKLETICS